jgi:hypothetical protein
VVVVVTVAVVVMKKPAPFETVWMQTAYKIGVKYEYR